MNKAVILAAGRGKRLWPYTDTTPKAALPIANKPLVAHTVESLKELGIDEIHVVVGYLDGDVRHALRMHPQIVFHRQASQGGTAAALVEAYSEGMGDCLVVYGDVLVTKDDLSRLIAAHRESSAIASVLVSPLDDEDPRDWICAHVERGAIARIVGHPRGAFGHRLAGVYALGEGAWSKVLAAPHSSTFVQVGQMPPVERELAQVIQSMVEDGETIPAVEAMRPTVDLDKPWHLLEANHVYIDLRSAQLEEDHIPDSAEISPHAEIQGHLVLGENVKIGPRVRIAGNVWIGDNTVIDNGAIIGANCWIGADCRIEHYCLISDYSVVGDNCVISHCAELSGMIMERVYLYHYMEFSGIIGRCTDLGAATVCGTLRFDDDQTTHRINSRRERPRRFANEIYIGDYCRTGVNVTLLPGVKMGAYSVAGPGLIVQEDIPSRTAVFVQQTVERRTWGPERYGW